MKIKKTFLLMILFILIVHIAYSEESTDNSNQINFVYDEANILSNDESINVDINNLYNYKGHKAKIIIYTNSDPEIAKSKIISGIQEYGIEDNTMNIYLVYSPGWYAPYFIYNKNCGLDKDQIKEMITEDFLGIGEELSNANYDYAFSILTVYLINEIEFSIDAEKISCAYIDDFTNKLSEDYDQAIVQSSPELIAIPSADLKRINQYQAAIDKAHKLYPKVSKNTIKAVIEKESNGVYNKVNSGSGATGLMQITALTGSEPAVRLVGLVQCAKCRSSASCPPTSSSCLRTAPQTRPASIPASSPKAKLYYDYRLNPEKNIVGGTAYLNQLIKRCENRDSYVNRVRQKALRLIERNVKLVEFKASLSSVLKDDLRFLASVLNYEADLTEIDYLKCALASYNYGPSNVETHAALADSLRFDNYKQNSGFPSETKNYVDTITGYIAWLNKNYPSGA